MSHSIATTTPKYRIAMLEPPGAIVAPCGFPANPRPKGVPRVFSDAMDVRIKVFCDEQKCDIEPELDEDDPRSWHFVLYETKDGDESEPVSVIRIVPPPHADHPNGYIDPEEEPYIKLGRVATLKKARGKGLSRQLTDEAFSWCAENSGSVGEGWNGNVLTHAQVVIEKMYQRLGFVTDDNLGRWDECGIEHLGMWKRLNIER